MDFASFQQHLLSSTSTADIAFHLRKLKRQLIGHRLWKIAYICRGLVRELHDLLGNLRHEIARSENEEILLEVAAIVSSLAQEGPAFTKPLLTGQIHSHLIDAFKYGYRARVKLSILKALIALANNLPLASNHAWDVDPTLADEFFVEPVAQHLKRFCTYEGQSQIDRQLCDAAMRIIQQLAHTTVHKAVLLEAGLIGVLAHKLANQVIGDGNRLFGTMSDKPQPFSDTQNSPSKAQVPSLARLLTTIIKVTDDSNAAVEDFLKQFLTPNFTASCAQWQSRVSGDFNPHQQYHTMSMNTVPQALNPFLSLLPDTADPDLARLARRSGFPLLGATVRGHTKRRTSSMRTTIERTSLVSEEAQTQSTQEHFLVSWLLYQARTRHTSVRVASVNLLAVLHRYGSISNTRIRGLASLLIPSLVDLLDTATRSTSGSEHDDIDDVADDDHSRASAALAVFVKDNALLMRAAVEATAISRLVQLLKDNLNETVNLELNLWWPDKLNSEVTGVDGERRLGPGGPTARMRRSMRTRQALLQALATLSAEEDEYKRDVCDKGALSSMLSSLVPFEAILEARAYGKMLRIEGNAPETLVAACNAIRSLTRSSTALRTKIVDTDVTKAVIKLLSAVEPEVRVAATMVLANLAHDFSPMRESLVDNNVLRKLCDHAHSANTRLRQESLFTLKAMVHRASTDLKRQVVEFLGTNWIKQLVSTDPQEVPPGVVIGLESQGYDKESLARLPSDLDEMDVDAANIKNGAVVEIFNKHTIQQDLEIQAEIMAFLRNLTTGKDAENIIDYLLGQIGKDEFMKMLVDRLRPHPLSLRGSSSAQILPTTLEHTLYIFVHMAAADRKYRNMIVEDTTLLQSYSQLLNHPQPSIRLACLWLTLNLIYPQAEPFDQAQRRGQALLLHGAKAHAVRIMQHDTVMDLKERASTVVDCFQKLML